MPYGPFFRHIKCGPENFQPKVYKRLFLNSDKCKLKQAFFSIKIKMKKADHLNSYIKERCSKIINTSRTTINIPHSLLSQDPGKGSSPSSFLSILPSYNGQREIPRSNRARCNINPLRYTIRYTYHSLTRSSCAETIEPLLTMTQLENNKQPLLFSKVININKTYGIHL